MLSNKIFKIIGVLLFLFWCGSVILQLLLKEFHPFLVISGFWLLTSTILSYLFFQITKRKKENIFKLALVFLCLLWGLILIAVSSELLFFFRGVPFIALDDVVYDLQQTGIANNFHKSDGISISGFMQGFYSGYPNFGGVLKYLFNSNHWIIPRLGTVLLFSYSSLIFYKICLLSYSVFASRIATSIFAFSPIFTYYAIFQLKDSLIVFLLLVSIYSLSLMIKEKSSYVFRILLIAGCLVLLISIRAMIIVTFLISLLVFLFYVFRGANKIKSFIILFFILIIVIYSWDIISMMGLFEDPSEYFDARFSSLGNTERMAGKASSLTTSGFAYLVSAPLFIILSPLVPIPSAVLFENPEYPNLNSELAGNIFLYALLPFFVNAILIYKHRRYPLVLYSIVFFIVYKFGSALSGMSLWSFRQGLPSTLALFLVFPLVFDNFHNRRGHRLLILVLFVLYFVWSLFRFYIRGG